MPQAPARVALETTLLVHGVPRESAKGLSRELRRIVESEGAAATFMGVLDGRPVVGMSDAQLDALIAQAAVPKLNTANLGLALSRALSGATTVSATMELAAAAGIRIFATGGIGGVHRATAGTTLDISSDLLAFTRFPVAVVTSGVKSILDVAATREALETLGIPVVGFQSDRFPAFYLRETDPPIGVDARFDDAADLAAYLRTELVRTGRGIVVANPIPARDQIAPANWQRWLDAAGSAAAAAGITGREVTPFVLSKLHEVSAGATLRANIALIKSNAALGARLAGAMAKAG